jgi:hypothetical protein
MEFYLLCIGHHPASEPVHDEDFWRDLVFFNNFLKEIR